MQEKSWDQQMEIGGRKEGGVGSERYHWLLLHDQLSANTW